MLLSSWMEIAALPRGEGSRDPSKVTWPDSMVSRRYAHTTADHTASLPKTLEWCYDLRIRTVTIYAFSMQNFNRSPEEVALLMSLAIEKFEYMASQSELVKKYDVQIRVIGELDRLPKDVHAAALRAIEMTKDNKRYRLLPVIGPDLCL